MAAKHSQKAEARLQAREQKRRARQARKALLAFLKRLRRACNKISTLEEWLDYTQELAQLLVTHQDGLTEAQRERLEQVLKATDLTKQGIQLACKTLQGELEQVIAALPADLLGLSAPTLTGLGISMATVVVGGMLLWQQVRQAVRFTIVNQACPPLAVSNTLTPEIRQILARLDVRLPEQVATDTQIGFSLPLLPADLTVDAQHPPDLMLRIEGRTGTLLAIMHFTLNARTEAVLFDNTPLLGKVTILPLDRAGKHTLIIRCRTP